MFLDIWPIHCFIHTLFEAVVIDVIVCIDQSINPRMEQTISSGELILRNRVDSALHIILYIYIQT